jgi:hypothetical protein
MPSLAARADMQTENIEVFTELQGGLADVAQSSQQYKDVKNKKFLTKALNDYRRLFSTPYELLSDFALNNFGALHAAALKPNLPYYSGLPEYTRGSSIRHQTLYSFNREAIMSYAFGSVEFANLYNCFYDYEQLPN